MARKHAQVLQRLDRFTREHFSSEHSILQRQLSRHVRGSRDLLVETGAEWRDLAMLLVPVLGHMKTNHVGVQSLVLVGSPPNVADVTGQFRQNIDGSSGITLTELGPDGDFRDEEQRVAGGPDIVVSSPPRLIDHIRRGNIRLDTVATCVVVPPPDDQSASFVADLHFVYAKMSRPRMVVFTPSIGGETDGVADLLKRPRTITREDWMGDRADKSSKDNTQERVVMSDQQFDPEEVKATIKSILKRVHEDEDPLELTAYKKFLKQNTSIFNRAYVAAYLLKYAEKTPGTGAAPAKGRGRNSRKGADRSAPAKSARSGSSNQSDPNKLSIFVSIGRSRRVHSRDLITLFTSVDGIAQEDLGQVKVLDNYSFVEVDSAKAQDAIDKLNGQELRGRTLTVNFARKK